MVLSESGVELVESRRLRLAEILHAQHAVEGVVLEDRLAVAGVDVVVGRALLAGAAAEIAEGLVGEAAGEAESPPSPCERDARHAAGVGAAELTERAAVELPVVTHEARLGRQHVDDAAHRVAAVERRPGAAHDLDPLDVVGIDECEVLVR